MPQCPQSTYSRVFSLVTVLFAVLSATLHAVTVDAGTADSGPGSVVTSALECKRNGQREEALRMVTDILRIWPDHRDGLWLRAWLHAEAGHTNEAAQDFRRLLEVHPLASQSGEARRALERMGFPAPTVAIPAPTPTRPAASAPSRQGRGHSSSGTQSRRLPPPKSQGNPALPSGPEEETPRSAASQPEAPGAPAPSGAALPPAPDSLCPPVERSSESPQPVLPPAPTPAGSRLPAPDPPPSAETQASPPAPADASGLRPDLVPETVSAVGKPAASGTVPGDLGRLFLEAELSFRARKYAESAEKLAAVVRTDPGYRNGQACGKLCRALFLSDQSYRALAMLSPLKDTWAQDPYARRQVALCEYAIQSAEGLPTDRVPDCVARAFCVEEAEYPKGASEVRRVGARIFEGLRDDYSKAKAAYEYVVRHTRYDSSLIPLGRQSPVSTLKTGRAVCTGFAQTYITLCRAGGVPARLVSGTSRSGFHNWAEVWLIGHGWVPADPTRGRNSGTPFGRLTADVRRDHSQRGNW